MKFKLHIEYDGGNFSGWQKQKNAKTIQGTLIEAIETALSKNNPKDVFIDLQGSGRTDAGVHAIEQVAHLECKTKLNPSQLRQKINDELSYAINVSKVEKVDDRFHARHSAKSRQYLYKITKKRNPFERKFAWCVKDKLDVEEMQIAAQLLVGEHNFISFSDKPTKEKSTFVLVKEVSVVEEGDNIFIRIKASHFLWKMVRRIVGVLIEIGKGKIDKEDLVQYLEVHTPSISIHTAPQNGLFLEKVEY